jgi:hypothetical protein
MKDDDAGLANAFASRNCSAATCFSFLTVESAALRPMYLMDSRPR